jgi:hypothetical protein
VQRVTAEVQRISSEIQRVAAEAQHLPPPVPGPSTGQGIQPGDFFWGPVPVHVYNSMSEPRKARFRQRVFDVVSRLCSVGINYWNNALFEQEFRSLASDFSLPLIWDSTQGLDRDAEWKRINDPSTSALVKMQSSKWLIDLWLDRELWMHGAKNSFIDFLLDAVRYLPVTND